MKNLFIKSCKEGTLSLDAKEIFVCLLRLLQNSNTKINYYHVVIRRGTNAFEWDIEIEWGLFLSKEVDQWNYMHDSMWERSKAMQHRGWIWNSFTCNPFSKTLTFRLWVVLFYITLILSMIEASWRLAKNILNQIRISF